MKDRRKEGSENAHVLLSHLISTHGRHVAMSMTVKKFPTFQGTRKFIAMFTRARHWSLLVHQRGGWGVGV